EVVLELCEKVCGADDLLAAAREVVLQVQVEPRSGQPTLSDLLSPELPVLVERRPVLLVERLDVGAASAGVMEEVVLDQVGGQQGLAQEVQRLENQLGVILIVEVDDHDDQALGQRVVERLQTA